MLTGLSTVCGLFSLLCKILSVLWPLGPSLVLLPWWDMRWQKNDPPCLLSVLLLSSVGQDNPKRYEYACVVPHKLIKFESLSLAQSYLILSMPLDRSFVLCSFPQNVFSFHMYLHRSGPVTVLHSYRAHCGYSGPAL